MVAYRKIMEFIRKHLPEKPYIEGVQRFSLRDKIFREVALNMLIHREYSSLYPTSFIIYSDCVIAENWNVPYAYGKIDLTTLRPHRKNPLIANVFSQMGIVEELGSGRNEPLIEEEDVYKVVIPLEATTMEGHDDIQKSIQKTPDKILSLIQTNPYITKNEMASALNLSVPAISKQLAQLKNQGRIRREGPDKGGHWVVETT